MTDDQEKGLQALLNVECKVKKTGCDGDWCSARALILEAFDLELPFKEEPKKEDPKKEEESK